MILAQKVANLEKVYNKHYLIALYQWQILKQQRDIYESTLIELSLEFNVPFITIYEPLCNDLRCNMILDETILFRDSNHLNIPGSILIGKFLSQKLNKIIEDKK